MLAQYPECEAMLEASAAASIALATQGVEVPTPSMTAITAAGQPNATVCDSLLRFSRLSLPAFICASISVAQVFSNSTIARYGATE